MTGQLFRPARHGRDLQAGVHDVRRRRTVTAQASHVPEVVLDAAGGDAGGAARWRLELDRYLAGSPDRVSVIGRGQQLTPAWLFRRERLARGAQLVVAPNNVSFSVSGGDRRVLLRNALHFVYASERHLLARMPKSFRIQIPVVHRMLSRASVIVVPCTAMAERVQYHVPSAAARVVIRPHPVTPTGARMPAEMPFVLVPVVPGPYKNLVPQLRLLLNTAERLKHPARIHVTARASDLPADLSTHPRIATMGAVPQSQLAEAWRSAAAVFYPSVLESFGYPLAEARAYGVPVIAPDTPQAREIAGRALVPYTPADHNSVAEAVCRIGEAVPAEPLAFDSTTYFAWLFAADNNPRRNR